VIKVFICLEFEHDIVCLCCVFLFVYFTKYRNLILMVFFVLVDLDDPYGPLSKQRSTDIGEGRITPTASSGMLIV
jgi:hypothetical protein